MSDYLNTKEAAELLRMDIRTLYKMTAERVIPFYKPGGKLILFMKSEIEEYLQKRRVQTIEEVKNEKFKNLKNKTK